MSTYQDRIEISTSGPRDMHDLTERVTSIVRDADVDTGLAHVHNGGSPGAVGTVEFEPGLQRDLPEKLDDLSRGTRRTPTSSAGTTATATFTFRPPR